MSMRANTTDVHGGKLQTLNMRMPFCLRLLLLLLDALKGIESFCHSAPPPLLLLAVCINECGLRKMVHMMEISSICRLSNYTKQLSSN